MAEIGRGGWCPRFPQLDALYVESAEGAGAHTRVPIGVEAALHFHDEGLDAMARGE